MGAGGERRLGVADCVLCGRCEMCGEAEGGRDEEEKREGWGSPPLLQEQEVKLRARALPQTHAPTPNSLSQDASA